MVEDNLRRRVEHIESLVARGRVARARSQTEELLTDFPHFWRGVRLLAQIAFERGDLDEAKPLYERVLAIVPEEAQSHRALSSILEQQGDGERALGHALCLYEQFPDRPEARDRLRALFQEVRGQALGPLPPTPAARGHMALRHDNPGAAWPLLRQALIESPTRLDLYSMLAMAAWLAGRKQLARHAARHLHEQRPSALVACLILGHPGSATRGGASTETFLAWATQLDPTHELAARLFGTPPARPRRASRAPTTPARRKRQRPRTARTATPSDDTPDWILYLLGRTRAELTRVPQPEHAPAPMDTSWLVSRRAELDRALAAPHGGPSVLAEPTSPAEAAWREGRSEEAVTLCREQLQGGTEERDAIVARLTRWASDPEAPATLYELLGDVARQSGDARRAAQFYREAFERG